MPPFPALIVYCHAHHDQHPPSSSSDLVIMSGENEEMEKLMNTRVIIDPEPLKYTYSWKGEKMIKCMRLVV